MKKNTAPIGIFDSGVGGLTVAHAVAQHLPAEHIVYYGDTAHMPYGDKSAAAIQAYSIKIVNFLLQNNCKLILIACNSASAAAYQLVQEYVDGKVLVVNVIDPVISYLAKNFDHHQVGLIGTRQTVQSGVYEKKIKTAGLTIDLIAQMTNLLAPAIEEFGDHEILNHLLNAYLSRFDQTQISGLILACTHYPLIKQRIAEYFQHKIEVIDSSHLVAITVKELLHQHQLLAEKQQATYKFFVSDLTPMFTHNAQLFFDQALQLHVHAFGN